MAISLSAAAPRNPPPITISTDRAHADPLAVSRLLATCNHSPHRFPALAAASGDYVPVSKLRTALDHSFLLVSVFCRARYSSGNRRVSSAFPFEELFDRVAPRPGSELRLVGFGRAVSDGGLTASIHDVAVTPSLRRLGIGRKIVERIIRTLTSRGIYDISALCSEEERLFFEACRFGDDTLGATTMMYTRTVPSNLEDCTTMISAGRMLLLVPPARKTCLSGRTNADVDNLGVPMQLL